MMNAGSAVFYLIPIGMWVNWAVAGVLTSVALAFLFLFDDKAKRSRFDAKAAASAGLALTSAEKALIVDD